MDMSPRPSASVKWRGVGAPSSREPTNSRQRHYLVPVAIFWPGTQEPIAAGRVVAPRRPSERGMGEVGWHVKAVGPGRKWEEETLLRRAGRSKRRAGHRRQNVSDPERLN
jgi:hypothetical protein